MAKKAEATETTGDYFDEIAAAMRDAGIVNPRELPDAVVDALRAKAGL